VDDPRLAGMFLDSRPSGPNRALQMETQYVPAALATDGKGESYARIAPTRFPRGAQGESRVVHRVTAYTKKALWDGVAAWFSGGPPASGAIDPKAAIRHEFPGRGGATWRIYGPGTPKEERVRIDWGSFAAPFAPDPHTFGYRWDPRHVTGGEAAAGRLVTLPEYFHLSKDDRGRARWVPIPGEDVPAETGLAEVGFERPREARPGPYVTPEDAESCWKKPGPVAGPFQAHPGDGSVVTYSWYRFADQPALQNADLSAEEREMLQKRVEKIHRHWERDRDYLEPPAMGELASIDPALIVTPPDGLEIGYVPIVIRQESRE
jgi:hypothetical protein